MEAIYSYFNFARNFWECITTASQPERELETDDSDEELTVTTAAMRDLVYLNWVI